MAYGQQNNIWGARSNAYGDEEKGKAFGSGMGGNSIQAVGGGFKNKNTGKMVLKTGAQILGTIYGGPAGGAAAGMAVDGFMPDKQSVKSGTSGFGQPKDGGSQMSMQQGGSSDPSGALTNVAMDQYEQYQKANGPLADPSNPVAEGMADKTSEIGANTVAESSKSAITDASSDQAADSMGNGLMYAKAAYDVSNKLNESGVMASEVGSGPTMNMDTSTTKQNKGPLSPLSKEEEDEYNKNMGVYAPLGGRG